MPAEPVTVFQFQGYSGPTPHPDIIAGYQTAIPHGGERLMALVEGEQAHRHAMAKSELRAGIAAHLVGSILAFALALAIIVLGYKLVDHDHDVAGYAVLLTGASGLIAAVFRSLRPGSD